MREILFRGFGITSRMWHEGELINTRGFIPPYMPMILEPDERSDGRAYDVYPESVGQFTGKTDKNGKKVFEHDILQIYTVWADGTVEKAGTGIVRWRENDQCYVLTTEDGYHIDDFGNYGRPEYFEVIGNIHDDPELLEER